jgi:amino acid transporter
VGFSLRLLVIQTGTIAAVAVAFGKFTGVVIPWVSAENYLAGSGAIGLTTQRLGAILVIALLTWSNTRGIRTGAVVQNIFTFAKVGALAGLIVRGSRWAAIRKQWPATSRISGATRDGISKRCGWWASL